MRILCQLSLNHGYYDRSIEWPWWWGVPRVSTWDLANRHWQFHQLVLSLSSPKIVKWRKQSRRLPWAPLLTALNIKIGYNIKKKFAFIFVSYVCDALSKTNGLWIGFWKFQPESESAIGTLMSSIHHKLQQQFESSFLPWACFKWPQAICHLDHIWSERSMKNMSILTQIEC